MGDKSKGSGKTMKKAPKADKHGKHGLRPHEQREQAGVVPIFKKPKKQPPHRHQRPGHSAGARRCAMGARRLALYAGTVRGAECQSCGGRIRPCRSAKMTASSFDRAFRRAVALARCARTSCTGI